MRVHFFVSLAWSVAASAYALFPALGLQVRDELPTCGCTTTEIDVQTTTVTYYARELERRQSQCATVTVTEEVYVYVYEPLQTVSVAVNNPASVQAQFSSDSIIDHVVYSENSQNAPVSEPWTNAMTFTNIATAPFLIATDAYPEYGTSIVYEYSTYEFLPISTNLVTISPSPANVATGASIATAPARIQGSGSGLAGLAAGAPAAEAARLVKKELGDSEIPFEKRQLPTTPPVSPAAGPTCTLIFAQIYGVWESWCNNWNGLSVVPQPTSFATTITATAGYNIPSIPSSVLHPSPATPVPVSLNSMTFSTVLTITEPIATSTISGELTSSSSGVTDSTLSLSTISSVGSSASGLTSTPASDSIVRTILSSSVAPSSLAVTSDTTSSSSTLTSTATQSANTCGQTAGVLINFDDLPVFSTNDPENPLTPPVPTPYDHFAWSDGYEYGPPGPKAYLPHDGSRLGQFNPADANLLAPMNSGTMRAGSFGAGTRAWNNIYYFDAHTAWVGCNNTATNTNCDFVATAYRWRATNSSTPHAGEEYAVHIQHFSPPTCTTATNCTLTEITFDAGQFTSLSSLNLYANVAGVITGFFVDDIAISWANDSCAAGLARLNSRKRDVGRRSLW